MKKILLVFICTLAFAATAPAGENDSSNNPRDNPKPPVSFEEEDTQKNIMNIGGFELIFPSTADTRSTLLTNFWNIGDYIEGRRNFSSSTNIIDMDLKIEDNVLSCDTQDHVIKIDNIPIGNFSIHPDEEQINKSFSFPIIGSGKHKIRIETTRTVSPGCGSAGFINDISTFTFDENCTPAEYSSTTKTLRIPKVRIDGSKCYSVEMTKRNGWNFSLSKATPISCD